jgi:hypothetical protein
MRTQLMKIFFPKGTSFYALNRRARARTRLVNGQMLLAITPEILATNGIHNMCAGGGAIRNSVRSVLPF